MVVGGWRAGGPWSNYVTGVEFLSGEVHTFGTRQRWWLHNVNVLNASEMVNFMLCEIDLQKFSEWQYRDVSCPVSLGCQCDLG